MTGSTDDMNKNKRALITPQTGPAADRKESIRVHFNPSTLQFQVANALQDEQGDDSGSKRQFVTKSTSKLSMELTFDTTDTFPASSVRNLTSRLAGFMDPEIANEAKTRRGKREVIQRQLPSVVLFEWGHFKFRGIIEQFKETIELFNADGVPLRSVVSITLASQSQVFGEAGKQKSPTPAAQEAPARSAAKNLRSMGSEGIKAARKTGNENQQDSVRNPGPGDTVKVTNKPELRDAMPFSQAPERAPGAGGSLGSSFAQNASASFGASAGFGASVRGSADLGSGFGTNTSIGGSTNFEHSFALGGSVGFETGASLNITSKFGSSASAGVAASQGAFSGLWSATSTRGRSVTRSAKIDVKVLRGEVTTQTRVTRQTSFGVTGRAETTSTSSETTHRTFRFEQEDS